MKPRNASTTPGALLSGIRTRSVLIGVLALLLEYASASAILPRLSSEERARLLTQACQAARAIFIGEITGAESYEGDGGIWTWYRVRVIEMLKGTMPTDGTIAFTARGGRCGGRTAWVEDSPNYRMGATFLLFLRPCGPLGDLQSLSGLMTAEIRGDSATYMAIRTVPTRALRDSIATRVRECSFEGQFAAADLAVVARIDSLDLGPSTVGRVTVIRLLAQRSDPKIAEGDRLQFTMATFEQLISRTVGTRPILTAGETYILFLHREGGEWRLPPTAYSAWQKVDDRGCVRLEMRGCTPAYAVAEEPWDSLLERAGQRR